MALQGADALRRRLKAIGNVPREAGRDWQRATVAYARLHIPIRTGATRASIRPGVISQKKVTVVGKYTINFIDAGAKAHEEPRSRFTKTGRRRRGKAAGTGKVLKFQIGGKTFFRRKVLKRAQAAHPFKHEAADVGLRFSNLGDRIITEWNKAA